MPGAGAFPSHGAAPNGGPVASVVVPTFEPPAMIAACVAALQAQAGCAIEIVVVDGGAAAPLPDLPQGPHPARARRQVNAGPAATRNAGAGALAVALFLARDAVAPTVDLAPVIRGIRARMSPAGRPPTAPIRQPVIRVPARGCRRAPLPGSATGWWHSARSAS
jgi:hypothetical protein